MTGFGGRIRSHGSRSGLAAALLTLAACTSTTSGSGTAAGPKLCAPVLFGVPGSGQGALNPPPSGADLPPGVTASDALHYGTSVARVKNALLAAAGTHGLAAATAIVYPAVPVDKYIDAKGLRGALETSEKQGVAALDTAIRASYRNGCADRPVLVTGYSQGAEVAIRAVDALSAAQQRAVTVVLLGNPSYEPDTAGDYPGHTSAAGLRPTFENGSAFRLTDDVRRHTLDVCAPGDPVCGVDPSAVTVVGRLLYVITHAKVHETAYADDTAGYATTAGRYLWQHRAR